MTTCSMLYQHKIKTTQQASSLIMRSTYTMYNTNGKDARTSTQHNNNHNNTYNDNSNKTKIKN